jgi:protein-S-isoprenylcysteine O-methyltransferase Ste14
VSGKIADGGNPAGLNPWQQALLGAFGEQYKEYMKRTKRLVPEIY